MSSAAPATAARELVLEALRRSGGIITDRHDAVAVLQERLEPHWTKRDTLVHLLLDMERDGQIERERPSQRRTTAIRLPPDEDPGLGPDGDIDRREAVRILVAGQARLEGHILAILSMLHEVQMSLQRMES